MLKLTQQEFTGLPQHLQLELLIGTALCLIGEQLVLRVLSGPAGLRCNGQHETCCSLGMSLLLLGSLLNCMSDVNLPYSLVRSAGGFIISGGVKPIVISRGAP